VEKKVFEMVEDYVQQQPEGRLGAEARFTMFDLLRNSALQTDRQPANGLIGRKGTLC